MRLDSSDMVREEKLAAYVLTIQCLGVSATSYWITFSWP